MFISLFIYEMRRELLVNVAMHVKNIKSIFFTYLSRDDSLQI